jgi:hypothetical protein
LAQASNVANAIGRDSYPKNAVAHSCDENRIAPRRASNDQNPEVLQIKWIKEAEENQN